MHNTTPSPTTVQIVRARWTSLAAILIVGLTLLLGQHAAVAQSLIIGDEAPAITVDEWFVEQPDLSSDAVRVVTFFDPSDRESWWALELCAALRPVFPDVQFIGLTGIDTRKQLLALLGEDGERFGFPIGYDDGKALWEDWVIQSRYFDVPVSYVIGTHGRLLWFGHPSRLEYVLTRIADDSWDPYADQAVIGQRKGLHRGLERVIVDEQWASALDILDRLLALSSDERDPLARSSVLEAYQRRFRVLFAEMGETERAYSFARRILLEKRDNGPLLNNVAWMIVDEPGVESRNLDLALSLSKQANELGTWTNPVYLDTIARIYFEKGELDEAVEFQRLAVTLAKPDDQGYDELSERLDRYERAAARDN